MCVCVCVCVRCLSNAVFSVFKLSNKIQFIFNKYMRLLPFPNSLASNLKGRLNLKFIEFVVKKKYSRY